MKIRKIDCVICVLCVLSLLGTVRAQEKYPTRGIELHVPFAPGGSSDIFARCYSEELSKILKVSVEVINRGGTGGVLGSSYVARAKNDGYTLLGASQAALVSAPTINKKTCPYDPVKDFDYIGRFGSVPSIFVVRSDSPFKTLVELVEYVRKNPGKVKNASAGTGSTSEFNLELLAANNKIKIPSIPFKSGGEAMVAVLGGHFDMTCNTLTSLGGQIKAGKLRGLAITSMKRVADFPDILTTAELGFPYININGWQGVAAPANLPRHVFDALAAAVNAAFHNPEVIQRAAKAGFTMEFMGPAEFKKSVEEELVIVEKIARETGLIEK